ncbi:hypothetical protein ACKGJY_01245 [Hyunsoonleella sp. 2307UL5-6]|uniref:hypothetical protein n=1 Tax=Hyunsoonleella sp. 2307UL5-6 TaxID=3384768 RepID=UPI0039BD2A6C
MKSLILIVFALLSNVSYCQEKKCSDYKVGVFEYTNSNYSDWQIKRTDNEQIEKNIKTGLVIHNSITWLSDCEFILTCTKVSKPSLEYAIGKIFRIRITETSNIGYTCIMMRNEIQKKDMVFEIKPLTTKTFSQKL